MFLFFRSFFSSVFFFYILWFFFRRNILLGIFIFLNFIIWFFYYFIHNYILKIVLLFRVLQVCFFLLSLNWLSFFFFFEILSFLVLPLLWRFGSQVEKFSAGYIFILLSFSRSIIFIFPLLFFLEDVYFLHKDVSFLVGVFLLLPFIIKRAVYPFHVWLPLVHVERRTSGSIYLASILLKVGSWGIILLFFFIPESFFSIFLVLLVISIIFCSMLIFLQRDRKKILAYSSVSHITLRILFLFIMNFFGFLNLLFLSVGHSVVAGVLFFILGILSGFVGTRIFYYKSGIFYLYRNIFLLVLFNLSNVGLPITLCFFSEIWGINVVCSSLCSFRFFLFLGYFFIYFSFFCYRFSFIFGKVIFLSSYKIESELFFFIFLYNSLFLFVWTLVYPRIFLLRRDGFCSFVYLFFLSYGYIKFMKKILF